MTLPFFHATPTTDLSPHISSPPHNLAHSYSLHYSLIINARANMSPAHSSAEASDRSQTRISFISEIEPTDDQGFEATMDLSQIHSEQKPLWVTSPVVIRKAIYDTIPHQLSLRSLMAAIDRKLDNLILAIRTRTEEYPVSEMQQQIQTMDSHIEVSSKGLRCIC